MSKAVNIRISGLQRDISDEPTVVECVGTLHSSVGQHYIRYTDPDGIQNLIKIRNGHATVTRTGALSSVMEFTEGNRTECVYPTPYGNFDTAIETETVTVSAENIRPEEPFARILYDLTMNSQKISGCELTICISEA